MKNSINQLFNNAIKDIQKDGYIKKPYNTSTPIKLGFSQSDFTKISYTTEKRQNELIEYGQMTGKTFDKAQRKKFFYHTTIEKIINKHFNEIVTDDYKVHKIVDELKKNLFALRKINLKVFEGNDIADIYAMKNHLLGTMSCMQEKPTSYFEIFNHLPVKMYAIIENDTLLARCLVWKLNRLNSDCIYIDRIYTYAQNENLSLDIYKSMISQIIKMNNIDTKENKVFGFNFRQITIDNIRGRYCPPIDYVSIDGAELTDFYHLPYMDTFKFGNECDNTLTIDKESDSTHLLDSTSGSFSEVEQQECECCGAPIDDDDRIYVEDEGEYRCEDCASYSEIDGCWYATENVTYIGGNVNDFVLTSDIDY
jgi:nitrogen regulatory protein PII